MATDAADEQWDQMSDAEQDAMVREVQARRHPEEAADSDASEAADDKTVDPEQKKTSGSDDETPGAADAGQQEAADGEEEVEGEGAETGQEPDWHDDADTWDFAKRMGISEEEYSDIQTREELDRVMRIIDRKAYDAEKAKEAGGKADAKGDAKAEAGADADAERPPDVMAEVEKVFGDTFEEDTKKALAQAMRILHGKHTEETKALREELGEFRKAEDARQEAETMRSISASIDALGKPDRYGKPGEKLSRQQAANREKVIEAHLTHAQGLMARGGNPAPTVEFLRAADALAFVEDNQRENQRQYDERLKKQSRRITGGSSRRALRKAVPEDKAARKKAILEDPEIERQFQRALGN